MFQRLRPNQDAVEALLVGGIRIGQKKRAGRRVVGDVERRPVSRAQVGGHLTRVILTGDPGDEHLKIIRAPVGRTENGLGIAGLHGKILLNIAARDIHELLADALATKRG